MLSFSQTDYVLWDNMSWNSGHSWKAVGEIYTSIETGFEYCMVWDITGLMHVSCTSADVDGSLEAITNVVSTYDSDQCQLHIVTSGVGDVSENDVEMAKTFNGQFRLWCTCFFLSLTCISSTGVIFAFNVKSTPKAADLARENKILVRHHNVIYRMFDDLKEQLTARLPPVTVEEVIGK